MRIERGGSTFHLTYCTNIHAADGWEAVYANVKQFAPALKRRLSRDSTFGVGLRLSARDARELLQKDRLAEFRSFLDAEGLYVALINGFPYGPFHRTTVKADVYAPDWREDARVRYTIDLVQILARLVPDHLDGGISTAPLSYKPWMARASADDWARLTHNVVRVVTEMVRVWERTATILHLDIEPEPDCLIETTGEFLDFFERHLLREGAQLLAERLQCSAAHARDHLRNHVRLCLDCCHYAVEFEDAEDAVRRLHAAGLHVGRVQLSSALKVRFPDRAADCGPILDRLQRFADSTYLHQVIARRDGVLQHYPDLDAALASNFAPGAEWRIHFHVPLFTADFEGLGSTQEYVRRVIDLTTARGAARHFEIETYTWDVLPAGLKIDLLESIAREYSWTMGVFA